MTTWFSVGDRVRVVDTGESWRDFTGEKGYVLSVAYSSDMPVYEVLLKNDDVEYFAEYQLQSYLYGG